jgi:hypothetical protein
MSYGSTRYDGNAYSIWSKIKKWQSELDALQRGSDGSKFSPEEIRGIIANVREASAKLGEEASLDQLSLIRDLTRRLEELTETVRTKSTWDKRFGTSHIKHNDD